MCAVLRNTGTPHVGPCLGLLRVFYLLRLFVGLLNATKTQLATVKISITKAPPQECFFVADSSAVEGKKKIKLFPC